ncbi:MAG TPA: hypothetical protein VM935_14615 [Chitinophagaceae bacterium]|nr:hypothetical protein [Chitinophagaceae bacterium]
MKKILLSLLCLTLISIATHAQFTVAKLVGKDSDKYGTGYGLFSYIDVPLAQENQSFRLELMDFAFFPTKGEKFFTSTAGAKSYLSIKLGYKYVISETQEGFYLLPSVGYCNTMLAIEGQEKIISNHGVAGALEGGYTVEVGQRGHTINLGVKYEYDRGSATNIIQTVGLRLSYGFGLFRRKND